MLLFTADKASINILSLCVNSTLENKALSEQT